MASVRGQIDANRLGEAGVDAASGSGRSVAPGDYFQQLLRLIQDALSPQSATVWGVDERGILTKIAEVARAKRGGQSNSTSARARTKRLLDALVGNGPRSHSTDAGHGAESSAELELLISYSDGIRPCGVIEVNLSQSPSAPFNVDHATAVLVEFAGYASRYVRSLQAAAAEPGVGQFAERLNKIVLELHRDLCVKHVALTAANEGRQLLGFDRSCLAGRRGRRTELLAVSGQERIVTRSNLVRAMTDLAAALIDANKPFRCDGDVEILPPQLRELVLEYLKESGASCIEAFPLRTPPPGDVNPDIVAQTDSIGVLIGEYFQPTTTHADPARAQIYADHVGLALGNAQHRERKSTSWQRRFRRFFGPSEFRNARQAAITCAAAAAMLVAVGMTPVAYRVEAPGRLMPMRRNSVFAPNDGRVTEVLVDGNQSVGHGQTLLRLANERLASEVLATRHQLQERQQLLATLEAQSAVAQDQGQGQDSIRLRGAISQSRIEIASQQGKLESLEAEVRELEVRAPLAGMVTTFDPQGLLLNRPVRRGESLLEVMDTDGPWEVVLDLPAHRIGHVLRARAAAGSSAVPVQFTVATQPEDVFTGALRTTPSRIVAGEDDESAARLEVNIAASEIDHPVAGADVIARIDCGKRALGWVLFGDVVDFFRRRWW